MGKLSKELRGAFTIRIILGVLAKGDNYGFAIRHKVNELSEGHIKWSDSSNYLVLKKMETQGLIKSYWKIEKNERPRKYYNLQEPGKAEFRNGLKE